MTGERLPPVQGEWIDRETPVCFSFEGKPFSGFSGDTVSSALWASGQKILGRSFKYHRPRGIFSLANHDINAMMQSGGVPNIRADITQIRNGMELFPVNTWGGLSRDRARILDHLSAFLPVGFYYKAFYGKRLFPYWERLFRAMTGLGRVDFSQPRQFTAKEHDFCSIAVVGAGPSGLSAALSAADLGADVVLVDENGHPGGSGHYQRGGDDSQWRTTEALWAKVLAHPRIRTRADTCAAGYYADHWIPLVSGQKMTKLRAGAVIFAMGAFEQPAVFRNNDLPGIMLASAAQRLIYRYAVRPMRNAVVLCGNSDGYRAALDLLAHGIRIAAILDFREADGSGSSRRVQDLGVPVHFGKCIYEAMPTADGKGVAGVRVARFQGGQALAGSGLEEISCDGVAVSVGWAPAANLLYQAGARMLFSTTLQQFVPGAFPQGIFACGRLNGVYGYGDRLQDGASAGQQAAAFLGYGECGPRPRFLEVAGPSHPWPVVPHPSGKNFVDLDEDLQLRDYANAIQEGFDSPELLKRYTTNGMGPSQGKHSSMNALRILAHYTGRAPGETGTTTARPFFHPVPLAILAGRGFHPERHTPMHEEHVALDAVWMRTGEWLRPEYYRSAGLDRAAAIQAEVRSVRQNVGLIDVGTLGKLEVSGPGAAEFLERIYLPRYANLKTGMTRYAVMCDEAGTVLDDGVVARLSGDLFYFTTTSSGAAGLYRELVRLNTLWQLDCTLANLTGAHAAVNLAGPKSREVLGLLADVDLAPASFPYLGVRQGRVAGIPARILRVGFVGEWGYEIHVPSSMGTALWKALLQAGRAFGIRAFGVEAQRILRLEKGHLIVGQDTDGLTTPFEAGLDWAVRMDKPFFVGKRSLQILSRTPPRQRLAGFVLESPLPGAIPEESCLVVQDGSIAGRITSIACSAACGAWVGMAMVDRELAAAGTAIRIRLASGALVRARITALPFYDPGQSRQKEVPCD